MLVWHNNGPWKRTVLWRDEDPSQVPETAQRRLQQTIDYRVPLDKYSDLIRFDRSAVAERTKGELSARCEGEEMNFLALNLANDLCIGRLSVDDARAKYTEIAAVFNKGDKHPYVQAFQFELPSAEETSDADEITVPEAILHKIGEKLGLVD